MRRRCEPGSKQWADYGGRGITVCERWQYFDNFIADMGPRPKGPPRYTLDRIDNNGNYEPGNCRWATYKTQQNNRRSNRLISIAGETFTLRQWLDRVGMSARAFYARMTRHGMTEEEALLIPNSRYVKSKRHRY